MVHSISAVSTASFWSKPSLQISVRDIASSASASNSVCSSPRPPPPSRRDSAPSGRRSSTQRTISGHEPSLSMLTVGGVPHAREPPSSAVGGFTNGTGGGLGLGGGSSELAGGGGGSAGRIWRRRAMWSSASSDVGPRWSRLARRSSALKGEIERASAYVVAKSAAARRAPTHGCSAGGKLSPCIGVGHSGRLTGGSSTNRWSAMG